MGENGRRLASEAAKIISFSLPAVAKPGAQRGLWLPWSVESVEDEYRRFFCVSFSLPAVAKPGAQRGL